MTLLDAASDALTAAGNPATLVAAIAALIAATAALVRGHGSQVAEQLKDLRGRVQALESELKAARDARAVAERERDEERTGKHQAIQAATAATARLELVERDAERRLRDALRAVEQSARERAQWERLAYAAKDELERHIRASTSGQLTPGHEPEGWATQDTWPPPKG